MSSNSKVIALWGKDTTEEYRVVLRGSSRLHSFVIERKQLDAMGEPSWVWDKSSEEVSGAFLELLKCIESGKFEIVRKY